MRDKEPKNGCSTHGPIFICGHTTLTCPDLKKILGGDQGGETTLAQRNDIIDTKVAEQSGGTYLERLQRVYEDECRDRWASSVDAIYSAPDGIKANKEKILRIAQERGGKIEQTDKGDLLNLIKDIDRQSNEILKLSADFRRNNTGMSEQTAQEVDDVVSELEGLLLLASQVKLDLLDS